MACKKVISVALVLAMILGAAPLMALATEEEYTAASVINFESPIFAEHVSYLVGKPVDRGQGSVGEITASRNAQKILPLPGNIGIDGQKGGNCRHQIRRVLAG